jgi:ferredoxin, 2Fe-2S
MYSITFKFEEKGKQTVVIDEAPVDDSILEVALKNGIDLHHNCGGVCACSTCHVYLESGQEFVEELSDKEEDFIDRAVNPRLNSRLSCQCVLVSGDGNIVVTVPDQSGFLGE